MKIKDIITVDQDEDKYLSFPDIIQSIKNSDRFFMVYRSGNGHHPTISKLVLKKSEDRGRTWETQQEFILNMEDDSLVWNCPRLSYILDVLYIVCDAKSSTFERVANFVTFFLTSDDEGISFEIEETPLPGMVPDKIIEFKGKYFCANHKVKNRNNKLIQLVSWSKEGVFWYDTNTMAHSLSRQFCEASIVNMNNKYMIAYLRDNSGHRRNLYTVRSEDGINWSDPHKLPIFGQRATAVRHGDSDVAVAIRNTDNLQVSLFIHDPKTNLVSTPLDIEGDYKRNQYNYGYTGLAETGNEYLLPYYIKKDADNPYIKLAFISK